MPPEPLPGWLTQEHGWAVPASVLAYLSALEKTVSGTCIGSPFNLPCRLSADAKPTSSLSKQGTSYKFVELGWGGGHTSVFPASAGQ